MGLGKSLICIALIASTLGEARAHYRIHRNVPNMIPTGGATLIICPMSVIVNWSEQLKDHWSGCVHTLQTGYEKSCGKPHKKGRKGSCLRVYLYHGAARCMDTSVLTGLDVVITTYNVVASEHTKGYSPLRSIKWFRIILDEAQYVFYVIFVFLLIYHCIVVLLKHVNPRRA